MPNWTPRPIKMDQPAYPRFMDRKIRLALSDTRIVMIGGPRQAGKTTLLKQVAGRARTFVTLDDPATHSAAMTDPLGFVSRVTKVAIDEIQRAPPLFPVIKMTVDTDQRPGRFLLTGSANILTIPTVSESFAGRMEILDLLPLAQCEIEKTRNDLLDDLFDGKGPPTGSYPLDPDDVVDRLLAGGYPEMRARTSQARRQAWARAYIDTILSRDVREISEATKLTDVGRLLQAMAAQSAQLVVHSQLAKLLQLDVKTVQRYVQTMEQMYLVRLLPAWHNNALKRLVKTPKLHFLDTGLLCALRNFTATRFQKERSTLGAALESFAISEIFKLASWSDNRFTFSHYRDKDQVEVDLIVERALGELVGFEIKAAATVTAADFKGLKRLQSVMGEGFRHGIVLHLGPETIPFGDRLTALPLQALWTS